MSAYDRDVKAMEILAAKKPYTYYCKNCGHFFYGMLSDGCPGCKSCDAWAIDMFPNLYFRWESLVEHEVVRQLKERCAKDLLEI